MDSVSTNKLQLMDGGYKLADNSTMNIFRQSDDGRHFNCDTCRAVMEHIEWWDMTKLDSWQVLLNYNQGKKRRTLLKTLRGL